jgi:hypothetical protein
LIFKQYKRTGVAEATPWAVGMDMSNISVGVEDTRRGSPKDGDMIARNPVNHKDMWLIAKEYFEANFVELNGNNFGWAIQQLKEGKRVARSGWNGKGMFLFLTKPLLAFSQNIDDYGVKNEPDTIGKSIVMKTADGKLVIGWLASQTDMLAEDWVVLND